MGKILYLECSPGISGDMTIGALLDLGAGRQVLGNVLGSPEVGGYHLYFGRKVMSGLDVLDFDVHLKEHERGHEEDHGHEKDHWHEGGHQYKDGHSHKREHSHENGHRHEAGYGHGVGHGHEHKHSHEVDYGHKHEHGHEADHGRPYPYIRRNFHDTYHIMDCLDSNEKVKEMARTMFRIVAEAESKAHGLSAEQVYFHEVGVIDSIVDIISAAVCIDNLGTEDVVVSALSEGRGHVYCQRGALPVPVPATTSIASSYGLKLHLIDNNEEVVIPAGAAIATILRTRNRPSSPCRLLKAGVSAGNKMFKQANVLQAMLLEISQKEDRIMWVLGTNLDNCTREMLGLAMEILLDAGTTDAWYIPIHMKKDRPAYMLFVLYRESSIEAAEEIILTQTTTIGVRRYLTERTILDRSEIQVKTGYGPVDVKMCAYKDRTFSYPEYESTQRTCREQGVDLQTAYRQAHMEAEENRRDQMYG